MLGIRMRLGMLLAFSVFATGGGSRKTKHDAEVSLGDEGGKPPSLHLAAYHGSCGALEAELKHTQAAGVNQPDQKGMSALQIAVARGHLCAVEALLRSGASPRQVIEEDGRTLLDFAVHAANQESASAAVGKIKTVLEAAVKEERWLDDESEDDESKERTYKISTFQQKPAPSSSPQDVKWQPVPETVSNPSLAESLIEGADRSGDGLLTLDELEDFADSSDENPFSPEEMMEKADANGDEQLSFEEVNEYVRKVLLTLPTNLGGPGPMAGEMKTEL
jgi:ankyrin repeat protein